MPKRKPLTEEQKRINRKLYRQRKETKQEVGRISPLKHFQGGDFDKTWLWADSNNYDEIYNNISIYNNLT